MGTVQSTWILLVYFGLFGSTFGPIRFTLVLSGPFWSLQSIGSILVHFNLISSIWVLLVHFGPFGQIWSTSIHFCPFGKEIMMLFCCDGMSATVGIRVFFGGAVLVPFQLDGYLVGWVIDKFLFKFQDGNVFDYNLICNCKYLNYNRSLLWEQIHK